MVTRGLTWKAMTPVYDRENSPRAPWFHEFEDSRVFREILVFEGFPETVAAQADEAGIVVDRFASDGRCILCNGEVVLY